MNQDKQRSNPGGAKIGAGMHGGRKRGVRSAWLSHSCRCLPLLPAILCMRLANPEPVRGEASARTVNRLPNSGFTECSNHPLIPDYWGIHRDGRLSLINLGLENFSLDPSVASPVEGARVLRIYSPGPIEYRNHVTGEPSRRPSFGWLVYGYPQAKHPAPLSQDASVTFSVYLRALEAETRVILHGKSWRKVAEFSVGPQWQRYHHTGSSPVTALSVTGKDALLWMAAPQLEAGDKPTAYQPSAAFRPAGAEHDLADLPRLTPTRLDAPPTLDGKLAGDVWERVEPVDGFVRLDTGEPAHVATRAYVAFDATTLYVAFRCEEPAMDALQVEERAYDGSVHVDDGVEVFLSPFPQADPYYQFSVNALGSRFDARGIGFGAAAWNTEWDAVTHHGDDHWSVEIAIPFSSLPAGPIGEAWRINLGRCRRADLELPKDNIWGGMAAEHSIWSGTPPGEARKNNAGFHDRSRFGLLVGLSPDVRGKGGPAVSVDPTPVPENRDLREYPAELMAFAEYGTFTNDAPLRIRVRWQKDEPVRVKVRLLNKQGAPVVEALRLRVPAATQTNATLPVAELPEGEYRLVAETEDRPDVFRAEDRIVKLPPVRPLTKINRFTRGLEVAGQPWFPTYLPNNAGKLDAPRINRLKAAGFNTVYGSGGPSMPLSKFVETGLDEEWKEQSLRNLDRLYEGGIRILFSLQGSVGLREWYQQGKTTGGDIQTLAACFTAMVDALKEHPAILAWYYLDEPSSVRWETNFGYRESDMRVLYEAVKAADPYRPVFVNWNNYWLDEPYGGVAASDILSHDDYSLSGPAFDLRKLVHAVSMINNAVTGRRPAIIWLSGSYKPFYGPPPHALRVHGWLHLVYGTRGIGYWSTQPMNPDTWRVMQDLNVEGRRLHSEILGQSDAQRLRTARSADVHYAVWATGQRACLLAVNVSDLPQEFDLELDSILGRPAAAAHRWFDPGRPVYREGRLRETLPPFARRVFVFDLD